MPNAAPVGRLRQVIPALRATLWLRPSLASVGAVGVVFSTLLLEQGLGPGWLPSPSTSTIEDILRAVAGAALTMATVALSVVVVVLNMVGGQASPRALPELMADRTVQNALAAFVGVFVLAVTGLLAVGMGLAGGMGRTFLALAAVGGALAIIAFFVGLIHHISDLLKLDSIVTRLHGVTAKAIAKLFERPPDDEPRPGAQAASRGAPAVPVFARGVGHVLDIDVAALSAAAGEHGLEIEIVVHVGDFVSALQPVLMMRPPPEREAIEEAAAAVRACLTVGRERDASVDPRHGLRLLGEIGCRALSTGINDPVTALVCLGHIADLLALPAAEPPEAWPSASSACGRVRLRQLAFPDLLAAGLPLIADFGHSTPMIVENVLEDLLRLHDLAHPGNRPALRSAATSFFERAAVALDAPDERSTLARFEPFVR